MMGDRPEVPANGEKRPVGEELAWQMIQAMQRMAQVIEEHTLVVRKQAELADELNGYFETIDRAMEICQEMVDDRAKGKVITGNDFVKAWLEAADEIMGEDEPGEGDPLVGVDRP